MGRAGLDGAKGGPRLGHVMTHKLRIQKKRSRAFAYDILTPLETNTQKKKMQAARWATAKSTRASQPFVGVCKVRIPVVEVVSLCSIFPLKNRTKSHPKPVALGERTGSL